MNILKKIVFTMVATLSLTTVSAKAAVNDKRLEASMNHLETLTPDRSATTEEVARHLDRNDKASVERIDKGAKKSKVARAKSKNVKKKAPYKSKKKKKRSAAKNKGKKVYSRTYKKK
ncbi:MAG: hypothetical protein I3J02_12105 [Prevotella sp.]|nr:hypothetical protein [Prevotella sp.]